MAFLIHVAHTCCMWNLIQIWIRFTKEYCLAMIFFQVKIHSRIYIWFHSCPSLRFQMKWLRWSRCCFIWILQYFDLKLIYWKYSNVHLRFHSNAFSQQPTLPHFRKLPAVTHVLTFKTACKMVSRRCVIAQFPQKINCILLSFS